MSLIFPFIAFLTGCVSYTQLEMVASKAPIDTSVISPKLDDISCSKIMIIPPSGTARGAFELQMTLFEKEFLRQGMTVISPAITGRIVMDSPDQTEEKNETGSILSDMERALVMAKNTGADAILQVGTFNWSERSDARFFVCPRGGTAPFEEVDRSQARIWNGAKVAFQSPQLEFVGKIVNVENGEVLATLDVSMPANYNLPENYRAKYLVYGNTANLAAGSEENFRYVVIKQETVGGILQRKPELPWFDEAQELTNQNLISYVAEQISLAVKKRFTVIPYGHAKLRKSLVFKVTFARF